MEKELTKQDIMSLLDAAQTLHVIKVRSLPATNHKPSRVKLYSARFKASKTLTYSFEFNDTRGDVMKYLTEAGFNVIGIGIAENGGQYFITDTLKSL